MWDRREVFKNDNSEHYIKITLVHEHYNYEHFKFGCLVSARLSHGEYEYCVFIEWE